MKNKSNAKREAKSREELNDFLKGGRSEYGMYSEIFDRGQQSVDRYLERGMQLPSFKWTNEFVQAGGRFDSCGTWGIQPQEGIKFEELGIPAEFAAKMLALLGRADYDYRHVGVIFQEGFNPQTRAEFHACARGIERKAKAENAMAKYKSTLRLGWMTDDEFVCYIIKTSSRIGEGTRHNSFNGIWITDSEKNDFGELEDFHCSTKNKNFLKNPVFSNWVAKRPKEEQMKLRQVAKMPIPQTGRVSNVPGRLMAAAMRHEKQYFINKLQCNHTSIGRIYETNDGILIHHKNYEPKTAKTVFGSKIRADLSAMEIADMWFVWNPENGFQNHVEAASLKEAVRLWENRSRRGEPRPLSLNDVRNDRSGTSGFCLEGAKGFLESRMPHVYRLIQAYTSWNEVPAETMSTVWDVDFNIFKGYPVP